jgi:acetyl-CoA acetyltransferase
MAEPRRKAVIAGIGLSDYPIAPNLTATQHHAQAMQRALEDCGLPKEEIDGYCCAGSGSWGTLDSAPFMAEYLGIDYRFLDGTFTGGSSYEHHLHHACAAIGAGLCETVLITYGSDQLSKSGMAIDLGASSRVEGALQVEAPYGLPLAGAYAMAARRHMHEYGTTSEQLAAIAVGVREFAAMNPQARYRDPISVEDVLSSRLVADPLHLLDCCVVTDGGGALVVTTEERARDLRHAGVQILATAGAQTHWIISQMPDYTDTAARGCATEMFRQTGLKRSDIDVLQLYDSFTITVLLLLEGLGFCDRGEGGPFVAEGHTAPGGSLPVNTDGGGLSSSHPGMRGIFLAIEAVRQLRGDAGVAQVPNAATALIAGSGGYLSGIATAILARPEVTG